jgi:Tol biopolymer transport system component
MGAGQTKRWILGILLICLLSVYLVGCVLQRKNVLNIPGIRLVAGQDVAFRMPSWSNSGLQLTFVNLGGMHSNQLYSDIYTTTVSVEDLRKITNESVGIEAGEPNWSYDDQEIAYSEDGVYMIKLDTGQVRLVASWANDGVLSPASNHLALWGLKDKAANNREWQLAILDLDTLTEKTIFTLQAEYIDLKGLSWTRDGKKIAFSMPTINSSSNAKRDWYNIYTIDTDGQNLKQITNFTSSDALSPTWSPDGRYIAYIQEVEFQKGILMIMHANGFCPVQLLNQAGIESPSWSPDGSQLAFEYSGGIYTLNLLAKEVSQKLSKQNCLQ